MSLMKNKNIILVGLMGAGKSTVGQRLAKKLNKKFIDADREIEIAAGCSVSDIFELYGEKEFRRLEFRVIERLIDENKNYVLSTIGELQKAGKDIENFNLVFGGDIPKGAGLSSSAALENSVVLALNSLFDLGLTKTEMIK